MESYILQRPIKQQTAVKTLLSRLQALSLGIRVYVLTSAISSCQIKTRCKKATFDLNCAPAVKTANFDTAREKKIYGGKWRSADIGNEKVSVIWSGLLAFKGLERDFAFHIHLVARDIRLNIALDGVIAMC